MNVTLIGLGCGPGSLTTEAQAALEQADLIVGARRLLEDLPETDAPKLAAVRATDILQALTGGAYQRPCVVYSGDSGFYSGSKGLYALLKERGIQAEILPGLSSIQVFAARLGVAWQDWNLVSAHGVDCDPVAEVSKDRDTFFLTSGADGPAALCRALTQAGLGSLPVSVGEDLGGEREAILHGTAEAFADKTCHPLNVMLAAAAPKAVRRVPGIPDDEFLRGKVPMTKQEVRAAILAKLAVAPGDVCWDVGAGTGSVSVELAMHSRAVWAIEEKAEALDLIRANRERFCTWNLQVVPGKAPNALQGLPRPDAVFIGGSGGALEAIVAAALEANPTARLCVSAIALETLSKAMDCFAAHGLETEVTQIAVSRTKGVGALHLLMAQNPVFLVSGRKV